MSLATEFRDFILRGNVVDLAVGVVIGAAFTGVVTAFTKDILTPLITIPGTVNFADWSFTIGGGKFLIGDFRRAATLYDRQEATVALSTEDGDNFVKNMVTIRCEARLGLALKNAGALSYGDFGNVA